MFRAVTNSAAASDGGSLLLFVEREDGTEEILGLDRAIASRGTPAHGRVTSSARPLSPAECRAAAAVLENLLPGTDEVHPIAEFIAALRAQG